MITGVRIPIVVMKYILSVTLIIVSPQVLGGTDEALKALKAKDFAKARIEAESEAENPLSQSILGSLYLNGNGVKKDPARALKHIEAAANGREVQAMAMLARFYEKGIDGVLEPDPVQAMKWYSILGGMGHYARVKDAMASLGATMTAEQKKEAMRLNREWMTNAVMETRKKSREKRLSKLPDEAKELEGYVEFWDALKPGTTEASRKDYEVVAWQEDEKRAVVQYLMFLRERAPHLLKRGGLGEEIRVYRAPLKNYAKGGRQYIILDEKAFSPLVADWIRRIVIHEIVHTADTFKFLSNSEEFRAVAEPRIKQAVSVLEKENLTPAQAAALPLGQRRDKVENLIKKKTGLPSAYAAENLSECLAEMISFWLDDTYSYKPPAEFLPFLRSLTQESPPVPVAVGKYLEGERLFGSRNFGAALASLTAAIDEDPRFYRAVALRGHTRERLGQNELAVRDMQDAVGLLSKYEQGYSFYLAELKRLQKTLSAVAQ